MGHLSWFAEVGQLNCFVGRINSAGLHSWVSSAVLQRGVSSAVLSGVGNLSCFTEVGHLTWFAEVGQLSCFVGGRVSSAVVEMSQLDV